MASSLPLRRLSAHPAWSAEAEGQLLGRAPAHLDEVDIEDVSKAYSLFCDVQRSSQFLKEYASDYMFNEIKATGDAQPMES